ncbi:MAG TPA: hypothetical protein VFW45_12155 [Candidatus Polarisedimenticolia bacterium]|nr:hypothetical protein [Candidatus Polarisedimenticolia bacterium]
MRLGRVAGFVLLAGALAPPAGAWTGPTRQHMVDDAIRMCPPSLATLLQRYRSDLIHGMMDPLAGESGEEHRQHLPGTYGGAASSIARHADQAVTIIGQPGRLRLAIYALGTAAHFTADVNFPLNCAAGGVGDPLFYNDYAVYAESKMARFPVVLDEKPRESLAKDRLEEFGLDAARRSSSLVTHVRSAYTPGGKRISAAAFDEKSLPFGVASLSYSQAVNDIARLWTHLWLRAGGDVSGQPFPFESGSTNGKTRKKSSKGAKDAAAR